MEWWKSYWVNRATIIKQSNPEDSTAEIQAALDGDEKLIVMPYTGTPWRTRPIQGRSNRKLVIEQGVELSDTEDGYEDKAVPMITADRLVGFEIKGYGATLRMNKAKYAALADGEWRAGVAFYGCTSSSLHGLSIIGTGGDCVYIGRNCQGIKVIDVLGSEAYRNGLSITGADDILVDGCTFANASGTNPQTGIDIEPNPGKSCTRIRVVNTHCVGSIWQYICNARIERVTAAFHDCLAEGGAGGYHVTGPQNVDSDPNTTIKFYDCVARNHRGCAVEIKNKRAELGEVLFTQCDLSAAGPAVFLSLNTAGLAAMEIFGGVTFENCITSEPRVQIYNAPAANARYEWKN